MKIAGIVSEYNPMHNGHIYQLEETRKNGATHIVAVMSGNYVQRGECAVIDKYTRSDIAIHNGVDLVVELPTPWSCDSAPNFAYGAVSILSSLGIDMLSFGSETDDLSLLSKCANEEDEEASKKIKEYLKKGYSYPLSVNKAVLDLFGKEQAAAVSSPNSTLGIEYIKALNKLSYNCEILPVKRKGANHDEKSLKGDFVSAGAIRALGFSDEIKPYVSSYCFFKMKELYEKGLAPCKMEENERGILSSLRKMSLLEIQNYIPDKRGLSERIFSAVKTSVSLDELYEKTKTKNVTLAKVRRSILRAFLEIEADISFEKPPYIKVLASNEKGLEIIRNKKGDIPIVTKHSDIANLSPYAKKVYELECKCTDQYSLFSKKIRACSLEQTSSVNIVK